MRREYVGSKRRACTFCSEYCKIYFSCVVEALEQLGQVGVAHLADAHCVLLDDTIAACLSRELMTLLPVEGETRLGIRDRAVLTQRSLQVVRALRRARCPCDHHHQLGGDCLAMGDHRRHEDGEARMALKEQLVDGRVECRRAVRGLSHVTLASLERTTFLPPATPAVPPSPPSLPGPPSDTVCLPPSPSWRQECTLELRAA